MEGSLTKKQEGLTDFQTLITALKLEESKNNIRLEKINPTELEEEDEEFYNIFLLGNLTAEKLTKHLDKVTKTGNPSQKEFHAYVANMFGVKNAKDMLEKMANKNRSQ